MYCSCKSCRDMPCMVISIVYNAKNGPNHGNHSIVVINTTHVTYNTPILSFLPFFFIAGKILPCFFSSMIMILLLNGRRYILPIALYFEKQADIFDFHSVNFSISMGFLTRLLRASKVFTTQQYPRQVFIYNSVDSVI